MRYRLRTVLISIFVATGMLNGCTLQITPRSARSPSTPIPAAALLTPVARSLPPAVPLRLPTTIAAPLIRYSDKTLGLQITLPATWAGYTLEHGRWNGFTPSSVAGDTGSLISFIDPQSTEVQPRQPIPVLIFTDAQWTQLQAGAWHINAAPFNPTLLSRNSRYVFALPARYNYSSLPGWEDVDQLLRKGAVEAFEPNSTAGLPPALR